MNPFAQLITSSQLKAAVLPALCLALAACGGHSGSSANNHGQVISNNQSQVTPNTPTQISWQMGSYAQSDTYADLCAAPRTGIDPETGKVYPDNFGSESTEKFWLRSVSHETYLWADELVDVNPNGFALLDYFDWLRTTTKTPSGKDKDQFHFSEKSADVYNDFVLGHDLTYGVEWDLIKGFYTVLYVLPGSPAEKAGVRRGSTLARIDGVPLSQMNAISIYEVLFPATSATHTFVMAENTESFTLTAETLQTQSVFPVQLLAGLAGEKIGYVEFNSFDGPSEAALIDTVNNLKTNQVDELVLDLRYNGGGYIDVASELAFMLAGANKTEGKVFAYTHVNAFLEQQVFSPDDLTEHFLSKTTGKTQNLASGQPLPQLNLKRLYVLTGEGTCSASELLINSLRGIDFPVIQIGSTTCGKPYGFFGLKNCGYDYFTINMQKRNAKGFGEYSDGMSPLDALVNQGSPAGCLVEDDLSKPMGNAEEKRLAAALLHISTGACTSSPSALVGEFLGVGKFGVPTHKGLAEHPWSRNMLK